jgi:hypothetical protein
MIRTAIRCRTGSSCISMVARRQERHNVQPIYRPWALLRSTEGTTYTIHQGGGPLGSQRMIAPVVWKTFR